MRTKRTMVGAGILTLAAWVVPGCIPGLVEVGREANDGLAGADPTGEAGGFGPDGGGQGGSKNAAGRAGTGAEAGKPAVAGRGGAGGSGAAAGSAGVGGSHRGGSGGAGGATGGTAGTSVNQGGEPGIAFDAACDCQVVEGEFSCTTSTEHFAAQSPVPADCENELNYVQRSACEDATTRYAWREGSENEYLAQMDGDALLYGHAYGYVGGMCDVSYTAGQLGQPYGTVTAGADTESLCFDACTVCGDSSGGSSCDSCTAVPGVPYAVTEPLEQYCTTHYCPATVAEAREHLTHQCPVVGSPDSYVDTGCGLVAVADRDGGVGFEGYYFDAQSGALVGTAVASDVPWGPCNAVEYRSGAVPTEQCVGNTECYFCTSADDGAGGAPGAAGAADGESYPVCAAP